MAKTSPPSWNLLTFSSSMPTGVTRCGQGRSSWMARGPGKTEGPLCKFAYGSTSSAKSYKILCYGDSNTAGFRPGKALVPYGQQLAEALQDVGLSGEVISCGLCGFTSEEMVNSIHMPSIETIVGRGEGLAHMLQDGGFDLVVIMAGTNDLGRRMDPEITRTFVSQLHCACHALGTPTVSVVPPSVSPVSKHPLSINIRDARERLGDKISRWADHCSQVLLSVDCEKLVPKRMTQFWEPDEIHLSATGSAQLAKELAVQLTTVLGQNQGRKQEIQPSASHQTPPRQFRSVAHENRKSVDGVPSKRRRKVSRQTQLGTGVSSTCGRTAIIGLSRGGWTPAVLPLSVCV